jgi:hypothetical protein
MVVLLARPSKPAPRSRSLGLRTLALPLTSPAPAPAPPPAVAATDADNDDDDDDDVVPAAAPSRRAWLGVNALLTAPSRMENLLTPVIPDPVPDPEPAAEAPPPSGGVQAIGGLRRLSELPLRCAREMPFSELASGCPPEYDAEGRWPMPEPAATREPGLLPMSLDEPAEEMRLFLACDAAVVAARMDSRLWRLAECRALRSLSVSMPEHSESLLALEFVPAPPPSRFRLAMFGRVVSGFVFVIDCGEFSSSVARRFDFGLLSVALRGGERVFDACDGLIARSGMDCWSSVSDDEARFNDSVGAAGDPFSLERDLDRNPAWKRLDRVAGGGGRLTASGMTRDGLDSSAESLLASR